MSERFGEADMRALYERTRNWGKWGDQDELGALNYIQASHRVAAAALVQKGTVVSCALDFPVTPGIANPTPAQHMMIVGGDDPCCATGPGLQTTLDYIGIAFHGLASSHIDALCHVGVDGQMYNGFPLTDVKTSGAHHNSIMSCKDGIFGRGVLLDIPALRAQAWISPEDMILPEELDAAADRQGVKVGEGDILLIYTGREQRIENMDKWDPGSVPLAGLHPLCADWLYQKRIAVLGGDGVHDPYPQLLELPGWAMPIHQCCLVGMGVHLMDNLSLKGLAAACADYQRWEFQFVVSPLKVAGGTGSPINPLAIF